MAKSNTPSNPNMSARSVDLFVDAPHDVHDIEGTDSGSTEELSILQTIRIAIGEEAVAGASAQEECIAEEVAQWIAKFIQVTLEYDEHSMSYIHGLTVRQLPLHDPFYKEHKDEIIVQSIDFITSEYVPLYDKLIDMFAAEGEVFSDKVALKLISTGALLVKDKPELFPDFRITEPYISQMIYGGEVERLMCHWALIEPAELQSAVNMALHVQPSIIGFVLDNLPSTITLSEDQLVFLAHSIPSKFCAQVKAGKIPEVRSSARVLHVLAKAGWDDQAMKFMSDKLLNELDFAGISSVFSGFIGGNILYRLVESGRISTEADMDQLFAVAGASGLTGSAFRLPRFIQSHIFKEEFTKPSDTPVQFYKISYFSSLEAEDYSYLLDNIDNMIDQGVEVSTIRKIFENISAELYTRFDVEAEPKLVETEERRAKSEMRNATRETQRELEKKYFKEDNIRIVPNSYEAELSEDEVVRAFEYEHCVKTMGLLQDIVNDPTRTNELTCVKTTERLTTSQLGADVQESVRTTVTEHEALQQLITYLAKRKEKMPDFPLFEILSNDLSFVGEKEYAEAVKGIAIYWKWFLDQDSEHQLYIDTAVSSSNTSVKSDVYMFDRILEHFSDEDMEKYWGQLLTKGAEIIQDDSSKVKVVLLDDWTISGAQLRTGYHRIVSERPELSPSVEVQLIAASAERIAMGIEDVAHWAKSVEDVCIPLVTRAYYLAHRTDVSGTQAVGSRITGAHSSVDYGFASDLQCHKEAHVNMPLLANVVRGYRQTSYVPKNINRLKSLYGL